MTGWFRCDVLRYCAVHGQHGRRQFVTAAVGSKKNCVLLLSLLGSECTSFHMTLSPLDEWCSSEHSKLQPPAASRARPPWRQQSARSDRASATAWLIGIHSAAIELDGRGGRLGSHRRDRQLLGPTYRSGPCQVLGLPHCCSFKHRIGQPCPENIRMHTFKLIAQTH